MATTWLFNPGRPCCAPSTTVCVQLNQCSNSTGLTGATVRLKQSGTALQTATPIGGGLHCFPAGVSAGSYQIGIAHPSFVSGAETEVDYTPPTGGGTDTVTVMMTPCGVLPTTLFLTGTDGTSLTLVWVPFVGWRDFKFVNTVGTLGTGGTCVARQNIICKITFNLTCVSSPTAGYQLTVSHNAGGDANVFITGCEPFYDYRSVELLPTTAGNHCPKATVNTNNTPFGNRTETGTATLANGHLVCSPAFSADYTLTFLPTTNHWGACWLPPPTPATPAGYVPLMNGTFTFTITK